MKCDAICRRFAWVVSKNSIGLSDVNLEFVAAVDSASEPWKENICMRRDRVD